MATESIENVIIFRADTGEAVRTVGDLRDNIKAYKAALDQVEIGTKEYDDTLKALQINQAALKDAMHATTSEENQQAASMESIAKAAMGAGNSYNALVKRMAELDQEFRRTEDTAKRQTIGAQIKEINQRLKDMDAERGKFQRNVGDYFGQALTSNMQKVVGALGNMGAGFRNVTSTATQATNAFKTLSATPVLGVLTLIAGALGKVVNGMQTCEENTNSWNRALAAFKPIADSFTRTMQAVGKSIADTANWIVDLLEKWGLLNEASQQRIAIEEKNQDIIKRQRAIALENANLENEVAQLRDKAAKKDKYTAKERVKFLEDAVKWESRIAKNNMTLAQERLAAAEEEAQLTGNSTETLNKINELKIAAVQAETNFYTTTRRLQSQLVTARAEILRESGQTVKQVTEDIGLLEVKLDELDDHMDKSLQRRLAKEKAAKEWEQMLTADGAEYIAALDEAWLAETDAIQGYLDEQLEAENNAYIEERRLKEQRLNLFMTYADGVANLASSIAAIYDVESDASEDAAQKSKAFKIAAAIISSIGGAVSAFTSTWSSELPLTAKAILAPINAASALAAGYAQVRQMQAVRVGNKSGSSVTMPSVVAAPAAAVSGMTNVRTITGASEEERLNRMASDTRVYVVESDITQAQNAQRVRVAEASF